MTKSSKVTIRPYHSVGNPRGYIHSTYNIRYQNTEMGNGNAMLMRDYTSSQARAPTR